MHEDVLLQVEGLVKDFHVRRSASADADEVLRAVNDVSFYIQRGETLGLVGESGCGKTTTGRSIIRAVEPTAGHVHYRMADETVVDITTLGEQELRQVRREVRLVFQDPFSSLNPRMTVFQLISAPLRANRLASTRSEMEARVASMLQDVGLNPDHMQRYPHAFSGGQRQRIAIARSLVSRPRLVIADEPVSALDVSVQAQVLNLLEQLKRDMDLTFLFIAHNLAVVEHMCERIAVMYMGRIVELTTREELFDRPRHPYTEALLAAIPNPDPDQRGRSLRLQGEVGDLVNPPSGCYFHPRCRFATDQCRNQTPALVADDEDTGNKDSGKQHLVACHRADELQLEGIE